MYLPLDGTAQRPPERCSGAQLLALLTPAMKECRLVSLCSIAYARQIEIVPATFISTLCESRLPFPKTTTATRRPQGSTRLTPTQFASRQMRQCHSTEVRTA